MAAFSIFRCFTTFTFIFIFYKPTFADLSSSFYYKQFTKDSNFDSHLVLFGDAKVINGSSSSSPSVQLTGSTSLNAGRLVHKKPIKLVEGKPRKLVSFSTYFSFKLSQENGNGLAFFMAPIKFPLKVFDNSSFGLSFDLNKSKMKVVAVEFDTYMDDKYGDLNNNHVGLDIGSLVSVKVSNVSFINMTLNSGKKLHCWINYEANSKHFEVRLSKFENQRPINPLLTYPIDFSKIWNETEVLVGFTSSNRNSSQTCNVCSWSLKLRHVLPWMHSQPLDPKQAFLNVSNTNPSNAHIRSQCVLRVVTALIFGTGCGILGAYCVLFIWTVFARKRSVVPDQRAASVHPMEFDYKKINHIKNGEKQVSS